MDITHLGATRTGARPATAEIWWRQDLNAPGTFSHPQRRPIET
jgi:hypothetical protein